MAASDPPSRIVVEYTRLLEEMAGQPNMALDTMRDAFLRQWDLIKFLRGQPLKHRFPLVVFVAAARPVVSSGVSSIRADLLVPLSGDIVLASGTGISLSELGNTITITGTGTAGAVTQLFDQTLAANAGALDTGANGIPQTANHLRIIVVARTTEAADPSNIGFQFNGDTGNNYGTQNLQAASANVAAGANSGIAVSNFGVAGSTLAAGVFAIWEFFIPNYTGTTLIKNFRGSGGVADPTSSNDFLQDRVGLWNSTAAINRIRMVPLTGGVNLVAGTRMTVYGLT